MRKTKKALYESIMNKIAPIVKQTLNEGAGAGYTVTIKGLHIDRDTLKLSKDGTFEAKLSAGLVDEWKAEGYYDAVTSKGYYLPVYDEDGNYLYSDEVEFDDAALEIKGGEIEGDIDLQDYDDIEDAKNDILYVLGDFEVSAMYGGGWSHCNLGEEFTLKDTYGYEINNENYYNVMVRKLTLNAPNIGLSIDSAFAEF